MAPASCLQCRNGSWIADSLMSLPVPSDGIAFSVYSAHWFVDQCKFGDSVVLFRSYCIRSCKYVFICICFVDDVWDGIVSLFPRRTLFSKYENLFGDTICRFWGSFHLRHLIEARRIHLLLLVFDFVWRFRLIWALTAVEWLVFLFCVSWFHFSCFAVACCCTLFFLLFGQEIVCCYEEFHRSWTTNYVFIIVCVYLLCHTSGFSLQVIAQSWLLSAFWLT